MQKCYSLLAILGKATLIFSILFYSLWKIVKEDIRRENEGARGEKEPFSIEAEGLISI